VTRLPIPLNALGLALPLALVETAGILGVRFWLTMLPKSSGWRIEEVVPRSSIGNDARFGLWPTAVHPFKTR
jgi:hypothetical protein